jgi:hypothetical protein
MRTWQYLQNPFLNATEDNFLSAMEICTYHEGALAVVKDDPFISPLYTRFHPLYLGYKTAYDNRFAQGGIQRSETLNVEQLLRLLLSSKIRQWDIRIQNVYPLDTVGYKRLLPNRRQPFQHGTQTERITAVKALTQNMGTDTKLAEVKTDIDTFYDQIDKALISQKGSLSSTKDKSSELETNRVAMSVGMYANLGTFIDKYAATPEKIEKFFDLETIRNIQQVVFTGTLKPGEVYNIVKHTFGVDDEVLLFNPGTAPLKFYLSNLPDAKSGDTAVTVVSGEQVVKASALGSLNNAYLTVCNADPALEGQFKLEIL